MTTFPKKATAAEITQWGSLKELLELTVMKHKVPEQQVFVPKQLFGMHAENTIMRNGYSEKGSI